MRSGQPPVAAIAGVRKPLALAAETGADVVRCVPPPVAESPSSGRAAQGQALDSPTWSRPGSGPRSAWWMEDHGGVLARLSSLPAPRHLLASRHEQDGLHGLHAPRHLPPILDQQQPADAEHCVDVVEEQLPNVAQDGTCHIIGESVTLAELRVLLEWPKVSPGAQLGGSGEGGTRRLHGAPPSPGAVAAPTGRTAWLPTAGPPSRGAAGEPAWPPPAGDGWLSSSEGLTACADHAARDAAQDVEEGQLAFSASMPAGMGLSRGVTLRPEQQLQPQPQPQLQRSLSSPSGAKKQPHPAKKSHLRDEPTGSLMARSQALTRQRLMLQDSQYMDRCISNLRSESREARKMGAFQDTAAEGPVIERFFDHPSPRGLRSASGNRSGNRSSSRSKRSTYFSRDSTALTPRATSSAGAFERGNQAAQLKDIARGLRESGVRVSQARSGKQMKQVTEKLTVMCGVARVARMRSRGEPDAKPPKLKLEKLNRLDRGARPRS